MERKHILNLLLLSLLVLMESCGHYSGFPVLIYKEYQVYPDSTVEPIIHPDAVLFQWTGTF